MNTSPTLARPAPKGRRLALDLPRVVFVTRKSPLELLVERAGTIGQARFQLGSNGLDFSRYEKQQEQFDTSLHALESSLASGQRRVRIDREELDRFLFAPDDLVVVVGQDGLVPNVAKYLDDQVVLGVNPHPEMYDGALCRYDPTSARAAIKSASTTVEALSIERRTMVEAVREDGQRLVALNEIFVGHRSHQSARYVLNAGDARERQSSSGIICATGTGSGGWARSIAEQRHLRTALPTPEESRLVWFVREPFPSVSTGTALDEGLLRPGEHLELVSELGGGGVAFGDGIESDWLEFVEGQTLRLAIASRHLRLAVPSPDLP